MKLQNILCKWVLIIVQMLVCSCTMLQQSLYTQNNDKNIIFLLNSEKNEYVEGETIYLEVIIKNVTTESINVQRPWERGQLHLDLKDKFGKAVPKGLAYSPSSEFILLAPNSSWKEIISLAAYVNDKDGYLRAGGTRLIAGVYTIQALLENLKSNLLTINIKKQTEHERSILEEMAKILIDNTKKDQALSMGRKLLKDFDQSVYIPKIYSWLLTLEDSKKNPENVIMLAEEYLSKFPNSFGASQILDKYIVGLKNKLKNDSKNKMDVQRQSQLIEKLTMLKRKFVNTKTSEYIDRVLESEKQKSNYE